MGIGSPRIPVWSVIGRRLISVAIGRQLVQYRPIGRCPLRPAYGCWRCSAWLAIVSRSASSMLSCRHLRLPSNGRQSRPLLSAVVVAAPCKMSHLGAALRPTLAGGRGTIYCGVFARDRRSPRRVQRQVDYRCVRATHQPVGRVCTIRQCIPRMVARSEIRRGAKAPRY